MTDLYHKAGAVAQARFRENTENRAVMAGVAKIPGRTECICCGKRRTTETGNSTARGLFVMGAGGERNGPHPLN